MIAFTVDRVQGSIFHHSSQGPVPTGSQAKNMVQCHLCASQACPHRIGCPLSHHWRVDPARIIHGPQTAVALVGMAAAAQGVELGQGVIAVIPANLPF